MEEEKVIKRKIIYQERGKPYKVVREDFRTEGGMPMYRRKIEGPGAEQFEWDNFQNLEAIVRRVNIAYNAGVHAKER